MPSFLQHNIVGLFTERAGALDAHALDALGSASAGSWRRTLPWLDLGGLALYLHALLERHGETARLPRSVRSRLEGNRSDNRLRALDTLAELATVNAAFATRGIPFLLLKGFSLIPEACPVAALRLQVDLDLLIDERDAGAAEDVLGRLNYGCTAVSGRTQEFRTRAATVPSLADIYRIKPQRSIDLKSAPSEAFAALRARSIVREVEGVSFPALGAEDRFSMQATHLLKHMRSEWLRLSWLLEFRNSIAFYRADSSFWQSLETRALADAELMTSLGAATALLREVFGGVPSVSLLQRAEATLDPRLSLWIHRYGRTTAMTPFPGSKLYLLQNLGQNLDRESEAATRRRRLLPRVAPPPIVPHVENASLGYRLRSAWAQWSFLLLRTRFHAREGLRYAREAPQWKRLLAEQIVQPE